MATQTIDFKYPDSLVEILGNSGITLVVSTYQSGKLIIVGRDRGGLDIRCADFPRPMGMCAQNDRLWAGMGHGIWEFANFASAAEKVDEDKAYTACYLPLGIRFTGDIDIHEMAWADRLYYINTKFSCLCTLDGPNSFSPVWKPPFISTLQPVDKCHLNGLGLRDGVPRYVTALGRTDQPLGWRETKADGGLIMDITTNEFLARGLSMPHSPRWHRDRIWFLESGKGSLSTLDPETNEVREVVRLPGFTRGLELIDEYAFIGVSKVRESATFSGLPVTRLPKRVCGVWMVNILTGQIVTYLEFTKGVDEIFALSLLPHAVTKIAGFDTPLSQANYRVADTGIAEISMPRTPVEVAAPYFEKGVDLFNAGEKETCLAQFEKTLAVQPDHLPASFNMAIALGDLGRFEAAESLLRTIIEKDASIAEAYNSLGYVYYKKGDFTQAETQFKTAIDLNPDYTQAKASLDILAREKKAARSYTTGVPGEKDPDRAAQ